MIIEDARFGPVGNTNRKCKDVTLKVRPMVNDGAINWKRNHAHKLFGDPQHQTEKEVKIWYRYQPGGTQMVASFPEINSTNRTIHIILPKDPATELPLSEPKTTETIEP